MTVSRPQAAATQARYDIYVGIHKALRMFMTDTLMRVGRMDADDADELAATLAQLESLLEICRRHLDHENRFIHPAIEACQPGGSDRVGGEHLQHLQAIAALEVDAAALRALPTAAAALRLYRRLACFVGENLEHMQVEETLHNAALWGAYDDAEIAAMEGAIHAVVSPAEMATLLHWFIPALSPAERAGMLGGMQRLLPPEDMREVLTLARRRLDDRSWGKLARALGLPVTPFPVAA